MLALGIPVAAASDNVRDAFYAYGDLDTWEVIVQTLRLAHLDNSYGTAVSLGTRAAAEIMGLPSHGNLEPGSKAELVVFPARNWSELFSRPWRERKLWRGTGWREAELPEFSELRF
jgi:cytosine deaminase